MFRVKMIGVGLGLDESAFGFAHFYAVDSEKSVYEKSFCDLKTAAYKHCRPEQGVKIYNILADEMIKLIFVAVPELLEIKAVSVAVIFAACHIADWSIEPDVEKFIFFAGDFKAEIRPVSRYVPVFQSRGKPFFEFIGDAPAGIAGGNNV